jgi:hypothetical protein
MEAAETKISLNNLIEEIISFAFRTGVYTIELRARAELDPDGTDRHEGS